MKTILIRGVPSGLARAAFWMAPGEPPGEPSGVADGGLTAQRLLPGFAAVGALLVLVVASDLLIWQVSAPGLSIAVMILAIAGTALALRPGAIQDKRAMLWAGFGLVLSLLPIVELVQALSLAFALLGLCHALVWIALGADGTASRALRGIARLPRAGLAQVWNDGRSALDAGATIRPGCSGLRRFLRDWVLSLGLGLVFVTLLAAANPVLDSWLKVFVDWQLAESITAERGTFWGAVALVLWPTLRLAAVGERMNRPTRAVLARPLGVGLFNPNSVTRALVTFNGLFVLQSGLDATYLWGGLSLPEGMTHAAYAHRGAYPLLITALLAGLFALLAQPHMVGRRHLRWLLLFWIGQNVLLVASSALRLDLYVEAYGLTRLRFAAFLWMGLVVAGLGQMLVQLQLGKSTGWLTARALLMGTATLYVVCFVNVAGVVAANNLARPDIPLDANYLCELGEGAVPAIRAHDAAGSTPLCFATLEINEPQDWREWGYRNARLRRSLPVTVPTDPSGEAQ